MTPTSDTPSGHHSDTPSADERGAESATEPRAEDKAGDLLRKERIKRRIAIDTIARDLKLNARYIKSLESNDYDNLPSTPYIRVYIRSIAKYLMLDPEGLLTQFYKEVGLTGEWGEKESNKINVSMSKKTTKQAPWLLLTILVLVIIAAVIVTQKGSNWETKKALRSTTDGAGVDSEDQLDSDIPPPRDTLAHDTSLPTIGEIPVNETDSETVLESQVPAQGMLRLTMRSLKDSVWVQVYSDGNSWRNFIWANKLRVFEARDSFNIHVGNNANLRYTLNGKPLTTIKGKGVVTFRIDHKGAENWSLSKWMKVFKEAN